MEPPSNSPAFVLDIFYLWYIFLTFTEVGVYLRGRRMYLMLMSLKKEKRKKRHFKNVQALQGNCEIKIDRTFLFLKHTCMFIWPYTSVMLCCFRHAIIDVIINTEKNCHISLLCQGITILILIINTNIHVFVFCA